MTTTPNPRVSDDKRARMLASLPFIEPESARADIADVLNDLADTREALRLANAARKAAEAERDLYKNNHDEAFKGEADALNKLADERAARVQAERALSETISATWSCGHARYQISAESHPECAVCYKAERDAARAEVAMLRDFLVRYGEHALGCPRYHDDVRGECVCGFSAALLDVHHRAFAAPQQEPE